MTSKSGHWNVTCFVQWWLASIDTESRCALVEEFIVVVTLIMFSLVGCECSGPAIMRPHSAEWSTWSCVIVGVVWLGSAKQLSRVLIDL